jgi:hypothetical protein
MTDRRYLFRRHSETDECDGPIEVTGKSEREIERLERGMLMNLHEDWFVEDAKVSELSADQRKQLGVGA